MEGLLWPTAHAWRLFVVNGKHAHEQPMPTFSAVIRYAVNKRAHVWTTYFKKELVCRTEHWATLSWQQREVRQTIVLGRWTVLYDQWSWLLFNVLILGQCRVYLPRIETKLSLHATKYHKAVATSAGKTCFVSNCMNFSKTETVSCVLLFAEPKYRPFADHTATVAGRNVGQSSTFMFGALCTLFTSVKTINRKRHESIQTIFRNINWVEWCWPRFGKQSRLRYGRIACVWTSQSGWRCGCRNLYAYCSNTALSNITTVAEAAP